MGGQVFKNHMVNEFDKEVETVIENITHPEEVKVEAEKLYIKWYVKNLCPFDYASKEDFIEYFTDQYNEYMEKYIDNFLNQTEVR